MKKVFIDTWAWVALANKRDSCHTQAEKENVRLLDDGASFVTTNFILDETYTLIRMRAGHKATVSFRREFVLPCIESGLVELVSITAESEDKAWEIFESYGDIKLSFTDCTSVAVMRHKELVEVFTGDTHFQHLGFTILPKT